jgi:hypothetical protein
MLQARARPAVRAQLFQTWPCPQDDENGRNRCHASTDVILAFLDVRSRRGEGGARYAELCCQNAQGFTVSLNHSIAA